MTTKFTIELARRINVLHETRAEGLVQRMESVEGRTVISGVAVLVLVQGYNMVTSGQIIAGLAMIGVGIVMTYTRELFFDIEYNGTGNIVEAMIAEKEDKEEDK